MNGGPVVWSSRLQKLCAQSSAEESEIYAVTDSLKEAVSLRLLCEESGIREPGIPMRIWEDNNAAICRARTAQLKSFKAFCRASTILERTRPCWYSGIC